MQILMETWESGSKAYMRSALLPPTWFAVLKLQILLQVCPSKTLWSAP